MKRSIVGLGLFFLTACGAPQDEAGQAVSSPPSDPLPFIVVTANPMATEAGARVLREGGSAVDAAVAVQAVLGLVEPQSSGLGGGAFMLLYDASSDELLAYDGRETAPLSTRPDVFLNEDGAPMGFYEAVTSGFSVGVPGVVAMLDTAHREHGRLAWSGLFTEAEQLASEGFPMPGRMHSLMVRFSDFRADPQAADYVGDDGQPKPAGTVVRNEAYAATVSQIADGGAAAFYTGSIADEIITRVNTRTGRETLTKQDFADYRPEERRPVCADAYRHRVCSMPPPSSGGVTLLQIIKLYERSAGASLVRQDLLSYIEASRLAYADRGRYLGDPTAMGTTLLGADDLVTSLVSDEYVTERASLIGSVPRREVEPGDPGGLLMREGFLQDSSYELPSTSHFSIRDREGNIVSMTSSVEFPFGSQMMAAGMVLNNQLTDFSRIPEEDGRTAVNAPGPGKRPMSSMTPVIVFGEAGGPVAAIGSPGGPAIIGYVAKPLIDHLGTGLALSEAASQPHIVVPRGSVIVEGGHPELKAAVAELGYDVSSRELTSGLYGFALQGGEIDTVVDARREGTAIVGGD
jgi:gamma-glutamyltranspeptidase/glutathione hydrolase